jgi:signal transduction histidine kinase
MSVEQAYDYKQAYLRERAARHKAEQLLDAKTRALYDNVLALESTVDELKRTQEQLIQSEKMASIGQLAAGVAHEINNPIGFVLSNTQVMGEYIDNLLKLDKFMMEKLPTPDSSALSEAYHQQRELLDIDYIREDIRELVNDSTSGLERVKDIVLNMKKVSHNSVCFEDCNLNDCIEQSLKVVMSEFKYKLIVRKQLSSLPLICAHPGHLQQVLINMFINAAHACEDKGLLVVSTSDECANGHGWVAITISDNGVGMPLDVQRKIFDPFYTTKDVGVGTGLGLSVAIGIIEKHKGQIMVDSEVGKGTTFTIQLPISQN